MLHIPIVHAHDVSKQIPRKKNFPLGWKCYKTIIGSYVSCAFIKIWSTWEVWRALKKLELLLATPQATLTHLLCSPNFPRASYLDECMLRYEPIFKFKSGDNFWKKSMESVTFVRLIYEIVKEALCREGLFGNILGN